MINISVEATTPDGRRFALRHGIPFEDIAELSPPRRPLPAEDVFQNAEYARWLGRRDSYVKMLGLSIANQIIQALSFPDGA